MGISSFNADSLSKKLEEMMSVIQQVNEQFRDPVGLVFTHSSPTILALTIQPHH